MRQQLLLCQKKTGLPAFIQLLEQTSRIGSTYMIYLVLLSGGKEITPMIAAGGALFSEIAATAACFLALGVDFSRENYHPLSGIMEAAQKSWLCSFFFKGNWRDCGASFCKQAAAYGAFRH